MRRIPGPLTGRQADNALLIAAALTARYLNSGDAHLEQFALGGVLRRRLVHQASGIVAAQLDIPVSQALLRLRAFAFGSGRTITEICQDVVDRRLYLGSSD
jgi:hypothetical protein